MNGLVSSGHLDNLCAAGWIQLPCSLLIAGISVFSVLLLRRISKLGSINHREGFESHRPHQFLLRLTSGTLPVSPFFGGRERDL